MGIKRCGYCGRRSRNDFCSNHPPRTCSVCMNVYYLNPWHKRGDFCSTACYHVSQKGVARPTHSEWMKGRFVGVKNPMYGKRGPLTGISPSVETRRKISLANVGKKRPQVSKANRERIVTKEQRSRMSESMKKFLCENPKRHGNYITATRNKISEPQKKLLVLVRNIFPEATSTYFIAFDNKVLYPDIAIPNLRIDIEYDGSYWHTNSADKDAIRNTIFLKNGWKVLRYIDYCPSEEELRNDLKELYNTPLIIKSFNIAAKIDEKELDILINK